MSGGARILDLKQIETPTLLHSTPGRARVNANARLHDLSAALGDTGQAFRNLGDINVQTLAGAMSTATHGTGQDLPSIAAEMTGAQLLSGSGALIEVPAEDVPGVQVSLGLLGILLEIELNTVPAFNLRRRVAVRPFEVLLDGMHDKWSAHRCYEFFLLPHSGKGVQISHDVTQAAPGKAPPDLDALGLQVMKLASVLRHLHPKLQRGVLALMLKLQAEEDYVGESWQVLSSTRAMRFNEMEYHLPPDTALEALEEVRTHIERKRPDVFFPFECRMTAGDTAWLSPFNDGPRISVAVHTHAPSGGHDAYDFLFTDIEPIFRRHGGRPHWGKLNALGADELRALYPRFDDFAKLVRELDPQGRLRNPYLQGLFGEDA